MNNIYLSKYGEKYVVDGVEHDIVKHSPTGMSWGYLGSGCADLALNILAKYVGREKAQENGLYQQFKSDIVARVPAEGGVIFHCDIVSWLKDKGVEV